MTRGSKIETPALEAGDHAARNGNGDREGTLRASCRVARRNQAAQDAEAGVSGWLEPAVFNEAFSDSLGQRSKRGGNQYRCQLYRMEAFPLATNRRKLQFSGMPLPNEKYVKGCVRDYPTEAGSSLPASHAGLEQNVRFCSSLA